MEKKAGSIKFANNSINIIVAVSYLQYARS
jgi:hypothetical protein